MKFLAHIFKFIWFFPTVISFILASFFEKAFLIIHHLHPRILVSFEIPKELDYLCFSFGSELVLRIVMVVLQHIIDFFKSLKDIATYEF